MSEEEDFELLISNEDYRKLESRCKELTHLYEKMESENKQLSLKILEAKQENAGNLKTIATLTDNIKYLSQKGLDMAKELISLEEESNKFKISMVENELDFSQKLKVSLTAQQTLDFKVSQLTIENVKMHAELEKCLNRLEVSKLSRHIQCSPKLMDVCVLTEMSSSEIDGLNQQNSQLSKKLADKVEELEKSQEELGKLKNELKVCAAELREKSINCEELENKLKQQQYRTRLAMTNFQEVQCKLRQAASEILSAQSQNMPLQEQINRLKNTLSMQAEDKKQQKQISQRLKMSILHLERELHSQEQELEKKKLEYAKLYEAASIAGQELDQKTNQLFSRARQLEDINIKLSELRKDIQIRENRENLLNNSVNGLQENLKILKQEMEDLRTSRDQALKKYNEMNALYQSKTNELESTKAKALQLDIEVRKLESTIQQLTHQEDEIRQQLIETMTHQEKLQEENTEINEEMRTHKQKLDAVFMENQTIYVMLKEEKNKSASLEEELDNAKGSFRLLLQQNQNLKTQLQQFSQKQNQTSTKNMGSLKSSELQTEIEMRRKNEEKHKQLISKLDTDRVNMEYSFLEEIKKLKSNYEKLKMEKLTMEEEYDKIIQDLQGEKSKKSSKQKNYSMEESIIDHFMIIKFNMVEMNLTHEEIQEIVQEEKNRLIKVIKEENSSIHNNK